LINAASAASKTRVIAGFKAYSLMIVVRKRKKQPAVSVSCCLNDVICFKST
jgi:hypothetical protein